MTPGTANLEAVTQTQDRLRRLLDEIVRMSVAGAEPAAFYGALLRRLMETLAASYGAVWWRDGEAIQLAIESNPGNLAEWKRTVRIEWVNRVANERAPAQHLADSKEITAQPGNIAPLAGSCLLAPVCSAQRAEAVLEIRLAPDRHAQAVAGMMQVLVRVADLASTYYSLRDSAALRDERLWAQIDAFAQRIHASLAPAEVAYRIANDGRTLLGCDRVSVALRKGKRVVIEAASGAEAVNQRAGLVTAMSGLCDRVMTWGETLVHQGQPDDSWPDDVARSLDRYLEQSHCKALLVVPLREEPDEKTGVAPPAVAALVMENFTSGALTPALVGRSAVLARHITPALRNAMTHRDVPLRFLWRPVAALQKAWGGKRRTLLIALTLGLIALVGALVFVPYPLKVEARGQLLPQERRWVYAPVEGQVVRIDDGLQSGSYVVKDQALILMHDLQLETKIVQLQQDIHSAQKEMDSLVKLVNSAATETDRLRHSSEHRQKEILRDRHALELAALRERTHSDPARPGAFWLKAPINGTLLSWDFRETLTHRLVKPVDPLLRIGDKNQAWEVELKIPQRNMGQVIQGFADPSPSSELDVDLLLSSMPTRPFKGKLTRARLAGEATTPRDGPDAESVVLASIRIDGDDIAATDRIPAELLVAGIEVHAKVRCRQHALGYSLFHGFWEFFYEKVVFFF